MARALAVGFVPQQHHFPGIFEKNRVWSAEEKAGLSHPVFGLKEVPNRPTNCLTLFERPPPQSSES